MSTAQYMVARREALGETVKFIEVGAVVATRRDFWNSSPGG